MNPLVFIIIPALVGAALIIYFIWGTQHLTQKNIIKTSLMYPRDRLIDLARGWDTEIIETRIIDNDNVLNLANGRIVTYPSSSLTLINSQEVIGNQICQKVWIVDIDYKLITNIKSLTSEYERLKAQHIYEIAKATDEKQRSESNIKEAAKNAKPNYNQGLAQHRSP